MQQTLNQDQQNAYNALFQFLASDEKEFVISGPAGVGKTFLMKHTVTNLLADYNKTCQLLGVPEVQYDIHLTATTNKAAEVLSLATGWPTSTIHAFMNLTVRDDYFSGESKIEPTRAWKVHANKLIFVDEASMVDTRLHSYIHKGTDSTCKIIYLGDHCQLAPVFETLSPVYKSPKFFAHLTTPVRNAETPALMQLCSDLRTTVETLKFSSISAHPGSIEYLDPEEATAFIDKTFLTDDSDARILCYSNKRVQEYNDYIRSLRGLPERFVKGEKVVNNSAVNVGGFMLRVEQVLTVTRSDEEYRHIILDPAKDIKMEVYSLDLLDLEDPELNHTHSVTVARYPEEMTNLLKYFAKKKDWSTYFQIKNNFPDLRIFDACTVYKSQGSTYDTVFLDLANIGKCTSADQVARMLYVGASRARKHIYMFGQLPKRLIQ